MSLEEFMAMFKLVDIITQGLDATSLRHKILSNNLANANTPQFRRSDIDFSSVYAEVNQIPMKSTHESHITTGIRISDNIPIVQDNSTSMRNDGSNVDVEREMIFLLENQLHYQAMTEVISRNLSLLRSVIGEGRR